MSLPQDLGVGIVGLGHIAQHHIAALDVTYGLHLVAACDLNEDTVATLPNGVSFSTKLDDMLGNPAVDLVIVAVPPKFHLEIVEAIFHSGRDAALEKPFVSTRSELDRLVALSKSSKAKIYPLLHAAFGLETLWFAEAYGPGGKLSDLGPVHGFSCHFYDPYIVDGVCRSPNLGGSWLDSAINALSVLDRFVSCRQLSLDTAVMTQVPEVFSGEVQGHALLRIENDDGTVGRGLIDTNWTLGLNQKTSRFFFQQGKIEVRLDHSAETVTLFDQGNKTRVMADLNKGTARLTSHYIGVFDELVASYSERRGNFLDVCEHHDIMFEALEKRYAFY